MLIDRSVWTIYDGKKKITLVSLVLPLLMQQIFTQLYGTANTFLLKGYSEVAVAASSVANQVLEISIMLMMVVTSGSVIISSISFGAGERDKAARVAGTGSVLILCISTLLAFINFFAAGPLMTFMNLEGEPFELACQYYRVRSLFLPVITMMSFFNHLLVCNGYSKYTLVVGVSSNALNIALSLVALYSPLDFMTPMSRVALAAGIAQLIGVLTALAFFVFKKCPYAFAFHPKDALKIFKLGVPSAMVSVMFRIAQTVTTSFVAAMGYSVVATKTYISTIVAYIPLLGFSIGQANSVFMGRYKGAGLLDKQKQLHRQDLLLAFSCNLVLSLLVLAFHRPLMSMFTSDVAIINATTAIFIIDIFVQLPRAINNISENSLSANGDVRTIFLTATLSCWLGSVALAYVFCVRLGMGLVGLWLAFAVDELIKTVIYIIRWRSGRWQNIDV